MSSAQESRVAAVTACYIIPIPLEILATSLRLYAKLRQGQKRRDGFTLDDFLIIFATVGGCPSFPASSFLVRPDNSLQVCAVGECCIGLAYGGTPCSLGQGIDLISRE